MTISILLGVILVLILIISFFPHRQVEFARKEIEARAALIQILVMLVLIATFAMYWQANEINRKAVIISHTPWINISPTITVNLDPHGVFVSSTVENKSDAPALNITSTTAVVSNGITPLRLVPTTGRSCLMPNSSMAADTVVAFPNPQTVYDAINSGNATVEIKVNFEDSFGDKITEITDLVKNPALNQFNITNTTVTGFQTY